MLGAIDPTHAPLDQGQLAVLAAVATFAGGGPAGLAGQNAMAGATAAQNEALNNSADHWGKNESEAQREQDALHKQQSKEKAQLGEGSIVDGGDGVSVLSPNPMAFGGAKSSTGPVTAQNFFDRSQYTSKVLNQAASGDYHGFPQSADAFSGDGTVSQIVGGDGVTRWRLAIPGSYNGKTGVFEYIRNPDEPGRVPGLCFMASASVASSPFNLPHSSSGASRRRAARKFPSPLPGARPR